MSLPLDCRALSVRESAETLGVSQQTVRAWIRAGVLAASQPSGRGGRLLVSRSGVEALVGSHGPATGHESAR